MRIIVKPLQEFHIELELPVGHLLNLNSLICFELGNNIIEHFEVSCIVIFVLRIEVQPMQRNLRIRVNGIQYLAIRDGITTQLDFRIVGLTNLVDPCKKLKSAQVSRFHYSNYNIINGIF